MKINFACGKQVWNGFYNIDAVRHPAAPRDPELIHAIKFDKNGDIINPIPLDDDCADELQAMHIIEHVYAWEAPALVKEWRRLLKPRGLLILELPNIEKAARNLLNGMNDQMAMWPIYGDWNHKDPYMMHKHGYTSATITELLRRCGFANALIKAPITHGARANRDMRVEAIK